MNSIIQNIAIYALPVIFAITLHEAAHGYVAKYFGDLTAYTQGRVSLNPVRHIDPIGTILLPLLTLLLGGILFGWAKPVPVNFSALRRPKQDMLWVALAGPGANFRRIVQGKLVAWQYQGGAQQGLIQFREESLYHRVIGNSQADGVAFRMLQAARHFLHGLKYEGVASGRAGLK